MLTAFDVGVGVLVLISALLATARGFTREVLSLATWLGAAAIAAYLYFYHGDLLKSYFSEELIGKIVLVAGSFIIALIILHLITMRIADFVVDSRIGPLDRTLGFVFGTARGVLIAVVGVVFFVWLIGDKLPTWATESKSLPMLQKLGDDLIAALPPDMEKQVTDLMHKRQGEEVAPDDTTPDETAPPDDSTDAPEDSAPLTPATPKAGTST